VFGFPATQRPSNAKLLDLLASRPAWFTYNENNHYRSTLGLSKFARETTSSAYVRADAALFNNRLKLVGGLRAEQANIEAEGPLEDLTRNYQRDAAGRVLRGANGQPLQIPGTALEISKRTYLERASHVKKEYLRWFPSLNASWNMRENTILRAAYYHSVGRPNYNQYAGGVTLPDLDAAPSPSNRIVVSNTAIKVWSARTGKIALEHYFEGVGLVSIGGFRRQFENFFGSTVFPRHAGLPLRARHLRRRVRALRRRHPVQPARGRPHPGSRFPVPPVPHLPALVGPRSAGDRQRRHPAHLRRRG
jgi:outer membrane receptor protein involved in Fe transport